FAADQWTDSGGIKNRAFTQTFTVQGTRGDLVKRTMVPVLDANGNPTGTQTEVITSLNGRTIGKQTINGLGYLEVAFQASGGNHLDPTSINGDELELRDSAGHLIPLGPTPVRVGLTDYYRYSFSGTLEPGEYTVTFRPGTLTDTGGIANQPQTEHFVVELATAKLANPTAGVVINREDFNSRGYIEVTFNPLQTSAGAAAFAADPKSILDASPEFTITGGADDHIELDATPIRLRDASGNLTNTYRYFFSGKFSNAPVTLTFIAGSWQDVAGNPVQQQQIDAQPPSAPAAATPGTLKRGPWIDVTFDPTNEARVDPQTINGDEFTLTGADGENLVLDAARKGFTLSFSGQLKIIKLGTVGATAGKFVLDMSNTLSSAPQFWGVATLETNFKVLEQFGVFLFAKGTLQINTTEFKK